MQNKGKLFTFFCLYIAQTIPMSFFSTVLPVIMRQQHFSLETIGMLQFLKLPWVLKFLWSPAVDRTSHSLGDYKRWIFSSEIIYAVAILAISFFDFHFSPYWVIALVVFSFVASATQDIATDALAVLSFDRKNKSLVNSMQSMGSFAGAMVGSGLLLLLYHQLGWSSLLPFLALFVVIALVPLLFFKDANGSLVQQKEVSKASVNDLLGFFKQKGIWKQVVFLALYYAGAVGTLSMLKPMLVDHGYSIKEIGVMLGIVGTSVGCVASLGGGFMIRKLSRYRARVIFAVPVLLSAVYFYVLVTQLPINTATLHLGITLLWGSYGMATIVVYTTAMDCVRKGYEGTDFTIQTVITHLSGMFMAAGAGQLAASFGYSGLFLVEAVVGAASLVYIVSAFRREGEPENLTKS